MTLRKTRGMAPAATAVSLLAGAANAATPSAAKQTADFQALFKEMVETGSRVDTGN